MFSRFWSMRLSGLELPDLQRDAVAGRVADGANMICGCGT